MNAGLFNFSVTANQHASAVVDRLGWETETHGHWIHGFENHFVMRHKLIYWINTKINDAKMAAAKAKKDKK